MNPRLLFAGAIAVLTLYAPPALAVYQCGPETDECQCGGPNPFPCCDNGGNCTWWAWDQACCHWGVIVPMLGNANTWAGVAANDPNYEVLSYPVVNSIACRASGQYGHVAWVTSVSGSTITVTEMNCWGNYGVRDWTYDASYFDGGYIVLKGSQCECTAGEEQSESCGDCGTRSRTCGSDCKWGGWGACAGPDPGGDCDTGSLGQCGVGTLRCVDGNTQCGTVHEPVDETCDGLDNDCDGTSDEEDVCGSGTGGASGAGGSNGSGGSSGSGGNTGGSGGGTWPSVDAGDEAGPKSSGPKFYEAEEADGCACDVALGGRGSRSGMWAMMLFGLVLWRLCDRKSV